MNFIQWRSSYVFCVIAAICIICVYDAYSRFAATSNGEIKSYSLDTITLSIVPSYSNEDTSKVLALYDIYQNDSETSVEQPGMTDEQQKQQNGELNQVFVGDKRLTLKAVMTNGEGINKQFTILLDVQELNSSQSKVHSFKKDSDVFGYTLNSISNTQVELTKSETKQHIVLKMYQPKRKSKGN